MLIFRREVVQEERSLFKEIVLCAKAYFLRSEINLGVERSGCTLIRFSRPSDDDELMLKVNGLAFMLLCEVQSSQLNRKFC